MRDVPDVEELPRVPSQSPAARVVTTIVVAAAVIERDGRILVTRRQPGVHLEGHWEFPGGKCESGESLAACLARELREELDAHAVVGPELLVTSHEYSDRRVELHFLRCDLAGEPTPALGQEMRWVSREEMSSLEFPPADAELIRWLQQRQT
jgi:mutator protein MutT